jgi:hypothetical protein
MRITFEGYRIYGRDRAYLTAFLCRLDEVTVFKQGFGSRLRWFDLEGNDWLIKPKLHFRDDQGIPSFEASGLRPCLNLTVHLECNPTRFRAHRGSHYRAIAAMPAAEALQVNPDARERGGNLSLDGNDNILTEAQWSSLGGWQRWFDLLLLKARAFIDETIQGVCDLPSEEALPNADWDVRACPDWRAAVIKQAEVYFERREELAIGTVYDLAPRLMDLSEALVATEHREGVEPGAPQIGVSGNAMSLSATLRGPDSRGKRVDLVVYAKAHDRLRIEIRYIGNLAQLLYRRAVRAGDDEPDEWPATLRAYFEDAVRDAVRRLTHIEEVLNPPIASRPATVTDIVMVTTALMSACDNDPALFNRLMAILLVRGGVTGNTDPAVMRALQELVERGILARRSIRTSGVGQLPRYTLAPRYRRMRNLLNTIPQQ